MPVTTIESSERQLLLPVNLERLVVTEETETGLESRLVGAWREWLHALATDAEAALAAAIAYRELPSEARDEWLGALEQDAEQISVPKFAVYAPLLAVESNPERRERIQRAVGPLDSATPRVGARGFQGSARNGAKIAVLVSPLYLDFVQVLACAYLPDMGFDWVRHDPIVDRHRAPRPGSLIDDTTIEEVPLGSLIDDLSHAVLSHRRNGRELPEALRVIADLFGPTPSSSTPPPPGDD